MIRSRIVSGFLTIVALSFVYVPVVTANPIVTFANRRVQGSVTTPLGSGNSYNIVETDDESVPFDHAIWATGTEPGVSAGYTAAQNSSISDFLIEATGSASATMTTTTALTQAYGDSYIYVFFTLDGNYKYDFYGAASASMGETIASLYGGPDTISPGVYITDTPLPISFSYSGTLAQGNYQLFFVSRASVSKSVALTTGSESSASFTGTLTLRAVPDGGNTTILFLLGSALLGVFAHRQQQRT